MDKRKVNGEDHLERLEQLFFEALEQPADRRDAFLATSCGSDTELRCSLEIMLRADGEHTALIDAAPWSVQHIENRLASCVADPLAQPGAMIGHYKLIDPIGRGGMGVVWRARRVDHHADRTVAIKFIPAGLDSPSAVRRFRHEERALARLEHPNIARLYDGGTTKQGRPYFVMEYVEGTPITEYSRQHNLPIAERLKLIKTICDAVQFAHGNLVLHRDLKPSNILITSEGVPKLLDFGIAKILDDSDRGAGEATVTDLRALTPKYASPEQVQGVPLSVASDVYSLGIILYELLVGRIPYQVEGKSRRELERAILEAEVTKPSAAVLVGKHVSAARCRARSRELRGHLDAICLTALQKSPSQRYRSAFELGDDLRRHLEGAPLRAKSPGPFTKIARTIRKRRGSIIATILGAMLGLGLASMYVVRAFLVPDWQEEHIRRARLAVIGDQGNSAIYSILFMTGLRWTPDWITEPTSEGGKLRSAAPDYAAALALGSVDDKVAAEALIVRLAEAMRSNSDDVTAVLAELHQRWPLTRSYAAAVINDRVPLRFAQDELNRASPDDLRAMGLFSLFIEDLETTIDAWTRLPMTEQDPIVECLLGYVYLALNEAELAYPRLLSAYRAYPESGTIALYLADAAIRCGDVPQAEHYLAVSERLGDRDGNFAYERVQMLVYLAKGEEAAAVDYYCTRFCHRSAVADLQFAQYMERTYGLEAAIRAISGRINRRTEKPDRAPWEYYSALMEAWWVECDDQQREALVNSVGKHPSMTAEEFHVLLRRYQLAMEAIRYQHPTNPQPVHGMYHRGRWAQLAQPVDAASRDRARSELLALTDRVQQIAPKNHCPEQCRY